MKSKEETPIFIIVGVDMSKDLTRSEPLPRNLRLFPRKAKEIYEAIYINTYIYEITGI